VVDDSHVKTSINAVSKAADPPEKRWFFAST
jgi:hypothetical protein